MRILIFLVNTVVLAAVAATPLSANNVTLTERDLQPIHKSVWIVPRLVLPLPNRDSPILGPNIRGDGVKLLRFLSGDTDINGFTGIVYDNRDRGHSTMDSEKFPQLAQIKYDQDLMEKELDIGLGGRVLLPAVVLGNSSMALRQGSLRRSLPRLAMTEPFWREVTPLLYANNHLYVYPEHKDFDGVDLFPINWPYMVISQGSSGSDQAFLQALAITLAAFPADTFAALREQRLVAPTLQMILRRNLSYIETREAYLSGAAHRPVLSREHIRSDWMVVMASEMRPEDIPPMVRLRVVEDEFATEAGLADKTERLLDSPSAIGRVWRDYAWEKTMVVSAEDTVGAAGQTLTFDWRVLQGNSDLIRIEPLDPEGRTARITVAWHDPWNIAVPIRETTSNRRVSRVDIGVFANNGVHDSAPAIVSIDFPAHQVRDYTTTSDGRRLVSIDYDARERKTYFDPILYWAAPWTDAARYNENGELVGWDRRDTTGETAFVPLAADTLDPKFTQITDTLPKVPATP